MDVHSWTKIFGQIILHFSFNYFLIGNMFTLLKIQKVLKSIYKKKSPTFSFWGILNSFKSVLLRIFYSMTESPEYLTNLLTKLLKNYCIPGAVLSRSVTSDASQPTSHLSYYLSPVAFTQMVVHDSCFSIPHCFCLTIHESWRSTQMHTHTFPHFFKCTTI